MLLAFKPLEKNYEKQQWHMRFGRWGHYRRMPPFLRLHRISLSLFTVSQRSASVGEPLYIVFWFKNATDVSKEINTALCRFFSGSAFASALCLHVKELVTPRLSLTCDLVSPTIVPFTSINTFCSNLSSSGVLLQFSGQCFTFWAWRASFGPGVVFHTLRCIILNGSEFLYKLHYFL